MTTAPAAPRHAHRGDGADGGDDAEMLRLTALKLGLDPTPSQVEALLAFLDLLARWTATYNLTAVRGRAAMLSQHLADCLALVAPLGRESFGRRLLDVGSGGGLPGAVLAIMRPDWEVTSVDAVAKKVAFVRQVAGQLGLRNLAAVHARVEQMSEARETRDMRHPPFDVIVARAFASLSDLVRLTRRQLRAGGVWVAMKGRLPDDERAALPADIDVFHVEPLVVPGLDAERCLVWMRLRRDT